MMMANSYGPLSMSFMSGIHLLGLAAVIGISVFIAMSVIRSLQDNRVSLR